MLALRTRAGVPDGPAADGLVADGLAERIGDRVVLTATGRLLANEATTRLLLAHSPADGRVAIRFHSCGSINFGGVPWTNARRPSSKR